MCFYVAGACRHWNILLNDFDLVVAHFADFCRHVIWLSAPWTQDTWNRFFRPDVHPSCTKETVWIRQHGRSFAPCSGYAHSTGSIQDADLEQFPAALPEHHLPWGTGCRSGWEWTEQWSFWCLEGDQGNYSTLGNHLRWSIIHQYTKAYPVFQNHCFFDDVRCLTLIIWWIFP